jgi:hypothetical protein
MVMGKKKMSVSEMRGKKAESQGGGEARQAAGGELHASRVPLAIQNEP